MILKRILYTAFIALASTSLFAQTKIATSSVFEEPLSEGWTKMIMLKNGNTFYFHFGSKKGIETFVWNKNRKFVGKNNIKSDNWSKKKKAEICGLYEIAGEPVIFLKYLNGLSPVLYRLRINPSNGRLIKEDVVCTLPELQMRGFYSAAYFYNYDAYNGELFENITVEKDPESDNYAVITSTDDENINQRLKVQLFDGSHKLLNSSSYTSTNPEYKKLDLIGVIVDGGKRVFIATYGAESSKGKNAHIVVSCLRTGDSIFSNKQLDFTEDFSNTKAQMVYDRKNNTIVMLTNSLAEKKSSSTSYVSFLSYIDPETLALKGVHAVSNEKINDYAQNALGLQLNYSGLPQKMIINSDNSITVLKEQMLSETIYHKGNPVSMYTFLGNIGITEIGSDGTEKAGFALMKNQMYGGKQEQMYMTGRDKGLWINELYSHRNVDDNLFLSYEYIRTPSCSYVLFNDDPRNNKKKENKTRRKTATSTDYINTVCYTLKDGTAKRGYLFGEPDKKTHSKACYIETSYFDRSTNTYVTVESDEHGLKYESRIAWIQF